MEHICVNLKKSTRKEITITFHTSILFCSATEYGLIRVHYILTTFGIHLTLWTLQFDPVRGLDSVLLLVSNFEMESNEYCAEVSPKTSERLMSGSTCAVLEVFCFILFTEQRQI